MTKLRNSETAIIDRVAAVKTIREYFKNKKSPELAQKHVAEFRSELNHKLELIKRSPELYAVRDDGYFRESLKKYRSFTAHWFTIFYTYEKDDNEVVIWFVRSSKSDYSNVLFLDQSR